jgi:eukaryotic-like serine/threonine-protein kinase
MPVDRPPRWVTGKYEAHELVGRGGAAEVWRGVVRGAAGFSRPVAIKRILPAFLALPEFVEMFVEEARIASQIHHSNVVQVYDFDQDYEGAFFLVMEWVEGLDLRRYLKTYSSLEHHAPWPLLTAVIIETLRGLAAAHERVDHRGRHAPVIHRDVTPQNILLSTSGIAKLTDFGMARAMDRARRTNPGIVKGKLAYLAPEITRGAAASVQSDLFSLGVVFWEGLAGRSLYIGDTDVDVFQRARDAEITPIEDLRGDLPPELTAALGRTLAPRPEDRFASAREALRALTTVLRSFPASTDSYVLSHSVIEACCVLGIPPDDIFVEGPPPPPTLLPASRNDPKASQGEPLSVRDLIEVLEGK